MKVRHAAASTYSIMRGWVGQEGGWGEYESSSKQVKGSRLIVSSFAEAGRGEVCTLRWWCIRLQVLFAVTRPMPVLPLAYPRFFTKKEGDTGSCCRA